MKRYSVAVWYGDAPEPEYFECHAESEEDAVVQASRAYPSADIGTVEIESCQWFAKCENEATCTTRHPIFGDIPTCERCHKFATS